MLDTGYIANISVTLLFPKYPLQKSLSRENTLLMSVTKVS